MNANTGVFVFTSINEYIRDTNFVLTDANSSYVLICMCSQNKNNLKIYKRSVTDHKDPEGQRMSRCTNFGILFSARF